MENCPVDVLSVCSAQGDIRPLRIRIPDGQQGMVRVDIQEVVSRKTVCFVGAESQTFLCRAQVWGESWLFELKYTIRSHSWSLVKRLH